MSKPSRRSDPLLLFFRESSNGVPENIEESITFQHRRAKTALVQAKHPAKTCAIHVKFRGGPCNYPWEEWAKSQRNLKPENQFYPVVAEMKRIKFYGWMQVGVDGFTTNLSSYAFLLGLVLELNPDATILILDQDLSFLEFSAKEFFDEIGEFKKESGVGDSEWARIFGPVMNTSREQKEEKLSIWSRMKGNVEARAAPEVNSLKNVIRRLFGVFGARLTLGLGSSVQEAAAKLEERNSDRYRNGLNAANVSLTLMTPRPTVGSTSDTLDPFHAPRLLYNMRAQTLVLNEFFFDALTEEQLDNFQYRTWEETERFMLRYFERWFALAQDDQLRG